MKRILLICFFALSWIVLLSSCVTRRACERKFPAQVETIVKDSTVVNTVTNYRDTTIAHYIVIPDTVYFDSVLITQYPGYLYKRVMIRGKWSEAVSWIEYEKLKLRLKEGGADSINIRLNKAIIEREIYKQMWKSTASTKVVKQAYIPKFVQFLAGVGGITIILLILYVVFRVFIKGMKLGL